MKPPRSSSRFTRASFALFSAMSALAPAFVAQAGTIQGYVAEAGLDGALQGVSVSIEGTTRTTATDRSGRFSLTNVAPGDYTVVFDYVGSESVTRTATVPVDPAAVVTVDAIVSSPAVVLDNLVVNAYATGTARAVNIQRTSANLREVVASDSFGQFPDGNAAEALNRVPGVSVERDQGEGRFVVVRGIDPNLNVVALDGVVLASPSADERKTLLDTIPLEVVDNLSVSKTTTPDQPGDAIGGYIEINSPSAFDHDGLTARASSALLYADLTEDFGSEFSASVGDRFGADQRWGVIVSTVYSTRDFGSDNVEADVWEPDGAGYTTGEFQYRDYNLTRERIGVNGNLEFRPNETNRYFLRAGFNQYRDDEERQALVIEPGDTGSVTVDSFTDADTAVARELKLREETMRIFATSLGGEHHPGDWIIDYAAALSFAEEDTPDEFEAVYALDGATETAFTGTSGRNPRVAFTGGDDALDPSGYEFDGITETEQLAKERDYTLKLNLRRDLASDALRYVKFGGLSRFKTKENDIEAFESDDNPDLADTYAPFATSGLRDFLGTGVPGIGGGIRDYFYQNRGDFAMERALEDSTVGDYETDENVFAAYAMAGFQFGKTSAIAGARLEHTEFETSGFSYNDDTDAVGAINASKDYTNVLPGLHLRHDANKTLVFRASATESISRPSFFQSAPGRLIKVDDDEIEQGNPDLDPYRSTNWDFSVQNYHETLGTFSAAVFFKDIRDFIYQQTLPGADAATGFDLVTYRNGSEGSILGLELGWQRELVAGFGLAASGTWSDGEATVLGAEDGDPERDLPFVKQSDFIGQLALTFEHKRLFSRLGYTFRTEYLDEIGGEPLEDRYVDDYFQLDFYGSYAFSRSWKVYVEINNLTNEPLEAYWGGSGRLAQYEEYGVSGAVGLKWQY
ncbi:MAG: TonB-dependent receptor [Burkholderiales bacterium]|nr:TonB-dependent receptor [Opitutaceae bacterium]